MYNADDIKKMVVRIGRLEKKIEKLRNQREHYREQVEFRDKILQYYPYAKRSYDTYKEAVKKSEELIMLRKRVKEQELLIERLTNGKN